jgi:hypothetical protein
MKKKTGCLTLALLTFLIIAPLPADSNQNTPYQAVPGLMDLRSTFSDGSHTIEDLVLLARSRGFKVLFINDHNRITLSYGVPPYRRIMRYKKEYPSIMTHGSDKFLAEIDRVSNKYPDTILIPGCITSAFYYWSGSWFKKNLTAHEYDRRILITNLNRAKDYNQIPSVGNKLSFNYTRQLLPGMVIFIFPLVVGVLMLRWRGTSRLIGLLITVLSILALIDYNPFRSSLFSPYHGDSGVKPFQEVIDYVNDHGGLAFWNYPEQQSGIRKHGPIRVNTPPYPQVLHLTENYTGFAAIYGDRITITEPGREWDRVLNEYCRGVRARPAWGISTADFHSDGRLGLKLGVFPTTFFVKAFSKEGVLEALKKGRMYSSRGDGYVWPKLDYFNVLGGATKKAFMGETLETSHFPLIKFRVSHKTKKKVPFTMALIRGGTLLETFRSEAPMEVEYMDKGITPGEMTYYRLMDTRKHLISNPIFIKYRPHSP